MREFINLNYNVELLEKDIQEINNGHYFKWKNRGYYFLPFSRSMEELNDILSISREIYNRGNAIDLIIDNIYGKALTEINEGYYVLLELPPNEEQEYTVTDILDLNNQLHLTTDKTKLYRNNWVELWSAKVDYVEYQIRNLGKDKKTVLNTLSYYVGLAENAITYANYTSKKYPMESTEKITLSHRRVYFPNYSKDFMNPLNFIFDLELRDIAEYIKSAFFNDIQTAYIELKTFLSKRRLSIFGYHMLYARLLYPSYYFDSYEMIMNGYKEEKELIKIIDKVELYENFLKDAYYLILEKCPIEKIDWIVNKKEL